MFDERTEATDGATYHWFSEALLRFLRHDTIRANANADDMDGGGGGQPDDQVRHHRYEQSYRYQRDEPHQSAAEISMKPVDTLDQSVVEVSKKPIVLPEKFRATEMMIVHQDIMQDHQLLLSSQLYQHRPEGFQGNQYKQQRGDDLADAITKMMWEQFGVRPTEKSICIGNVS
jgi:hypothetical protein